jgi:hypothetical protein
MLFVRMPLLRQGSGGQATRKLTNPDVHIFTRSKLPCDQLALLEDKPAPKARGKKSGGQWAKDAPIAHTTVKGATTRKPAGVFAVYYDMKTEWPAASLKRREVCLK